MLKENKAYVLLTLDLGGTWGARRSWRARGVALLNEALRYIFKIVVYTVQDIDFVFSEF